MARELGVSSQLYGMYEMGKREPGASFFVAWKRVFGEDLTENIETIVPRGQVPLSNRNYQPSPESDYLPEYLESLKEQKRILEEQNQFLRRNFEVSLNSIAEVQQASLVHIKALAWYSASVQVGENETRTVKELTKINSKVSEYLAAGVKKDS